MTEYIKKIKLPNNNEYDIFDAVARTSKNVFTDTVTGAVNIAGANDHVYLNHVQGTTVNSTHRIKGSGITTVSTDANGNLTIDTPASSVATIIGENAIPASEKAAANGVAPLNGNKKIDIGYLPGYVDDIVEGYLYNNHFYKEAAHTNLVTLSESTEVIDQKTGYMFLELSTNKIYRWSGSTYVEISTDTLAKQIPSTTDADYRVLLSSSANDTEETAGTFKSTKIKANPATGKLTATKFAGEAVNAITEITTTTASKNVVSNISTASINKITDNTTVTPVIATVTGEKLVLTDVNASSITHAAQTVVTGVTTAAQTIVSAVSTNTASVIKNVG